jgi:hypothetical protein
VLDGYDSHVNKAGYEVEGEVVRGGIDERIGYSQCFLRPIFLSGTSIDITDSQQLQQLLSWNKKALWVSTRGGIVEVSVERSDREVRRMNRKGQ